MLLDRASEVTAKITTFQKLKSAANEAGMFATRAGQFRAVAQRIVNLRATLQALRVAGIPVDFAPLDGTGLAAKARQLKSLVQEDPAKINDPPFDLRFAFTERLAEVAKAGERAALAAWTGYVGKRAAFGSDDVLSALAVVPQFRASVGQIRQLRANVAGLGSALPADPLATVIKIDALAAEHDRAWAALDATDIPSSVVGFIRAAANQGATLGTFTTEVRTWLESRNLLGAFRIKLS
jgi:hypothetical protein